MCPGGGGNEGLAGASIPPRIGKVPQKRPNMEI